MTVKAKKRPKSRKHREKSHIPGMEPVEYPKIDAAAKIYADARDDRIKASKDESEAKVNLIAEMNTAGVQRYERDGVVVELIGKQDVRVREAKEKTEENGEKE